QQQLALQLPEVAVLGIVRGPCRSRPKNWLERSTDLNRHRTDDGAACAKTRICCSDEVDELASDIAVNLD
ncbi:unnamed protein product, partial [Symbiodinium sp. CCMP2456]